MIDKFPIKNLRSAEFVQFIKSACAILDKYGLDAENLGTYYDKLREYCLACKAAMAVEKGNEKIRVKNEADRYRDRLHSKLFNHVKTILYDEQDPRFEAARHVMKVIRDSGNPANAAENAESALLTALNDKLNAHRADVDAIAAGDIVDALAEANNRFIALEEECREITAATKTTRPPSILTIRKQSTPVYRAIINAINGYADTPARKDAYRDMIAEMNTLVAKYDNLLAQRTGVPANPKPEIPS